MRLTARTFTKHARAGLGTRALMARVGQPYERLASRYAYCAKAGGKKKVVLTVSLTPGGRVSGVLRTR